MNLIPLCPNCHLTDQHDPTKTMEQEKLRWFRKYKVPTILKPQFHPLYNRLLFLNSVSENTDVDELQNNIEELASFIEELEMGDFYSKKIREITKKSKYVHVYVLGDPESERRDRQNRIAEAKEYRQKIMRVKDAVFSLVFELLRYQNWV